MTQYIALFLSICSLVVSFLSYRGSHITQRAYVSVDAKGETVEVPDILGLLKEPSSQEQPKKPVIWQRATATIHIIGSSPAHDIASRAECGYTTSRVDITGGKLVVLGESPYTKEGNGTENIKGQYHVPGETAQAATCTFAPRKRTELFQLTTNIMKGSITYTDELGTHHFKNFCFEVRGTDVSPCDSGNDAN